MSKNEIELIRTIRESADPAKAMEMAMTMLARIVAGESMGSVATSYGIGTEEVILV